MDQEIEAQAKEFLAFLEQCRQQPRAKATSELNASLSHLHTFLTSIQPLIEPWPITNDPTIDSMTAYASELYPTLGLLLEMLCRNPVVTASGSSRGLAEVVAQSVIKFSARTGGSAAVGAGSKSAMTGSPSAEQSWRVARMRDMFRAQQQQDGLGRKKRNCTGGSSSRHLPYSEQNRSMETKSDPFQDIFKVSDKELKEREMEQTLITMAGNLKTLQDQVAKTELTDTTWSSLIIWNRQLSELCAPLALTLSATELLEGIVGTAYILYSKRPLGASGLVPLRLIDSSFVESLMKQQSDATVFSVLKDHQALAQLLVISPLARQCCLVQLIDGVVQDCAHALDVYQSRHQIKQRHFESSQFLRSALSRHLPKDQHHQLVERILEDSAEVAGEIDDWRIVRIWILLIEWVLTRLGSRESMHALPLESDASSLDPSADLFAVISTACSIVNCRESELNGADGSRASLNAATVSEIDTLLKIQGRYVFESAPPQEMALRRRMVFLIGSAVASSNGLLTSLILQHIRSLDKVDPHLKQELSAPSQVTTTLLNLLSLLVYGELGSACFLTIDQPFLALLRELQATLRESEISNPYDLRLGTVADLEGIFSKYMSFLRLNTVVTADIVCAIVIYNDPKNSSFWQSIISVILRILTSSESTSLMTALPAFMARLRDLSEIMVVPGLSRALDTLLVTPAMTTTTMTAASTFHNKH
ncbi:hypothetical protein K457DRAFT_132274 [Linnemannia elongata AG-77]|uniref:Uncharacterized protein n=1 Tax=Linnemannia elongata AG-77 TaxID=1314771 RepID=A0A197KFJ6_9FUNG|nr:hypothetical protein K457DRAFT_132274 [Linnemannia elongata AG-77]